MKTFNHDSLIQQYSVKCTESIDCDEVSRKIETIYYDDGDDVSADNNLKKMNYEEQHLEDNKYFYDDNNSGMRQWTDNCDITVRVETINLNEMPLDLSIRHNR